MQTDPIEVVTPAASLPVTLAELKSHLQLNRDDDDADLTLFLQSAIDTFEFETGRPPIATVYRQYTRFPDYTHAPIVLARGKVSAIASVKYTDPAGSEVTLAGTRPDLAGPIGRVFGPFSTGWPLVDLTAIHPVRVEFTAGWANAAAVPADVKVAIRMLAAHWYASRDAYGAELKTETPDGFRRVCDKYRLSMGII